jgi:dimethylamine monooxygenase subunit A
VTSARHDRDLFWTNSPWRGGRGGYRMGLRPVAAAEWLSEPISPSERARKAALIQRNRPTVFAALADTDAAQARTLDFVRTRAGVPVEGDAIALQPLARAALAVPDDLCLMRSDDGHYRLVAACVCSPSYWSLAEKIGGTLADVHAPVPGLQAKLGARMAAFLQRLPADTIFERRNWFLHLDDEPFHPASEDWSAVAECLDPRLLVMRSERQTLARVADDLVLFTIRVTCRPFAEIAGFPAAARDLLDALDSLGEDERAASGYRFYAAAVRRYLDDRTFAS